MMGVLVTTNLLDRLGEVWGYFPSILLKDSKERSQLLPNISIGRY
jgi:hypothetical protein